MAIRAINNIRDAQQAIKDLQDYLPTQINNTVQKTVSAQKKIITYVSQEIGNNNAISGGSSTIPISPSPGTVFLVLLAHTLQAGANTFNGSPIVSAKNPANNIATGYAVGGVIQLFWTGSLWLDLSQ